MSDTPRTDNAVLFAISRGMTLAPLAEFARELERENAALRSIASAMAEEMEQHGGEQAFDSLARYRAEMGKEAQP